MGIYSFLSSVFKFLVYVFTIKSLQKIGGGKKRNQKPIEEGKKADVFNSTKRNILYAPFSTHVYALFMIGGDST